MNIGVVTPYDSANYGAYLQAYATKIYLESFGHKVIFIKWRSEELRKQVYFNKTGLGLKSKIISLKLRKHRADNYNKMTNALNKFEIIDISEISKNTLDVIILGSDEIWNINVKNFQNEIFYGGNLKNVPVIAYAPSAGNAKSSDFKKFPNICNLINKISIVGVRDENTKNIVEEISGITPNIVCDPTLLVPINDYELQSIDFITSRYVLVYSYFVDKRFRNYLIKFARAKKLTLVSVCMHQSWCDKNICCEPLQFMTLIRNADYVFTTTFHGSIFTLSQHKNCAIYAESKKLIDLVSWTNMRSTLVESECSYEDFCKVIEFKHDYKVFEEKLDERRLYSRKLYKDALSELNGD